MVQFRKNNKKADGDVPHVSAKSIKGSAASFRKSFMKVIGSGDEVNQNDSRRVFVGFDKIESSAPSPAKDPKDDEHSPAAAMQHFPNNQVISSKYSAYDFLPRFLFESIAFRFANFYFLVVSILQMIPIISTTDGVPFSLLPLSVVLTIEGIAAALEDYQRHLDDAAANSSITTQVLRNGELLKKPWKDVHVGDILKIQNRESIPADCAIIAASDEPPAAVCYVETKSLDGETNLKLRQGIPEVAEAIAEKAKEFSNQGHTIDNLHPMDKAVSRVCGVVECEQPNVFLDKFTGAALFELGPQTIDLSKEKTPLGIKNILLRGCVVRSTDYVYGLVLNTGHDTKIVQSTTKTAGKVSELDKAINRNLVSFLLGEFILCMLGAGLSLWWSNNAGADVDYLFLDSFQASDFVIRVFTFFLLVANMIPISLYVSMKFARFFQSFFIYWDLGIRYRGEDPNSGEQLDLPTIVRTMDLNDSLGQISYIFSDKTGTLTNNVMEFRKFSVNGVSYGLGTTVIGVAALERADKFKEAKEAQKELEMLERAPHPRFVNYRDRPEAPLGAQLAGRGGHLGGADAAQLKKARDFFTVLSVCHSVLVETIRDDDGNDTGELRLSASSPDDQALVAAAREFGYNFVGRGDGGRTVLVEQGPPSTYIANYAEYDPKSPTQQEKGELKTYELLQILEFTSSRKRMSVIVKDPAGTIRLMCKGADSEVYKRLTEAERHGKIAENTDAHVTQFADDGLRTLAVAWKVLDEVEFHSWNERFKRAAADLTEMDLRKNKQKNAIDDLMDEIETNLELLGATAIEDKLQDGVPDAIASLGRANIKLWVLTGDKQETAINIGFACQLIDRSMKRFVINYTSAENEEDMFNLLVDLLTEVSEDRRRAAHAGELNNPETDTLNMALVIDGDALKLALSEKCRMKLLSLGKQCRSVVACRCSPKQKSEVVDLVRKNEASAKTLAIGDGANDVSMIQTAHIGVGISGQEGMQAVNASDYAIAQFKYLKRLLLVHGRLNYMRTSRLCVVMFYKNVMLILAQIWLSYFNGFSGQKFYLQLSVEAYNLIFTMGPIILISAFDRDLPDEAMLRNPGLYEVGLDARLFNFKVFWSWVANGVYHSFWAFLVPLGMFMPGYIDLWMFGCIVFTSVATISNFKIALEQRSWAKVNIIVWLLTLISWPVFALVLELDIWVQFRWGWEWNSIFSSTFSRLDGIAAFVLLLVGALFRDFFWKSFKREVFPESRHIIQERVVKLGLIGDVMAGDEVKSSIEGTQREDSKDLDVTVQDATGKPVAVSPEDKDRAPGTGAGTTASREEREREGEEEEEEEEAPVRRSSFARKPSTDYGDVELHVQRRSSLSGSRQAGGSNAGQGEERRSSLSRGKTAGAGAGAGAGTGSGVFSPSAATTVPLDGDVTVDLEEGQTTGVGEGEGTAAEEGETTETPSFYHGYSFSADDSTSTLQASKIRLSLVGEAPSLDETV